MFSPPPGASVRATRLAGLKGLLVAVVLLAGSCLVVGLIPTTYRRLLARAVAPLWLFALIIIVASVDRAVFGGAPSSGSRRWLRLVLALAVTAVIIGGLSVGAIVVALRWHL